jgi:DNA-binding NarL/FixJ family response regulator
MDLMIPGGIGGKETINLLLKIDHSAKVIVSSGYSTDPIMANYGHYGFSAVLIKPDSTELVI